MREILAAEADGDEAATLALEVYLHRLRASIATMVAALGGLDVLVFTGGVGENAPAIRERTVAGLGFLGVTIDAAANAEPHADGEISAADASVRTLVIGAREDLEIAREVRRVLGIGAGVA